METAYWHLVAARRDLEVRRGTIALAEQQRTDTQSRIASGTVPESDLAQPTAEVERRRGDLFAAQEAVARAERALKQLMLDSSADPLWSVEVVPADEAHHVGGGGVDEVADVVVRGVEHALDVGQLEEDHQPHGEQGVVGGADVGDVVVHLVGHQPELLEDQPVGDLLDALAAAAGGVPSRGPCSSARRRATLRWC